MSLAFSTLICLGLLASCAQPPEYQVAPRGKNTDDSNPNKKPREPKVPEGPEEPNPGPVDPEIPEKPVEPVDPIDPVDKPTVPEMPDEPMKPVEPEVPKPVDPLTLPSYTPDAADAATVRNRLGDLQDDSDVNDKNGTARGKWEKFSFKSQDSKIYKGDNKELDQKGSFTWGGNLYIPANYVEGTELPFMLVGDAGWQQHQIMRQVLDNLISQKRIPPMAAILMHPGTINGKGDGPGSQRSFEYDDLSPRYSEFIETEILPMLKNQFKVNFTTNPNGRGTLGGSSSGAMAFTAAWFHPDRYRRVVAYSGTFTDRTSSPYYPDPNDWGAYDYHSGKNLVKNADRKPIRVWMQVGSNDLSPLGQERNNWASANELMQKVLLEKGYPRKYMFTEGAGHIENRVYRSTLPKALEWVWKGYSPTDPK